MPYTEILTDFRDPTGAPANGTLVVKLRQTILVDGDEIPGSIGILATFLVVNGVAYRAPGLPMRLPATDHTCTPNYVPLDLSIEMSSGINAGKTVNLGTIVVPTSAVPVDIATLLDFGPGGDPVPPAGLPYVPAVLLDAQIAPAVVSGLTVPVALVTVRDIRVMLARGSARFLGTLRVLTDGVTAAVRYEGTDLGDDLGVDFDAGVNAGNLEVYYTTTDTGDSVTARFYPTDTLFP